MIVVMCEERETIKIKNKYFNEIYCKINNLTCDVLKSEYV